ncbi:MAG: hypothetical protein WA941_09935 [Nitrososphaeraceae archaeon]
MAATASDGWRCLADNKSLDILRSIHESQPISIIYLNLSRKQYYSRLAKLSRCNLVYRSGGKYTVTSLGKIAYGVVQRIAALEKDYWKFVAIDTLESVANIQISDEERKKIICSIIKDMQTREILFSAKQPLRDIDSQSIDA